MPEAWGNQNGRTHGECSRTRKTSVYRRWRNIKQRCCNPSHSSYHNYGGRGITLCLEWQESFPAFATYVRGTFGIQEIPDHLEIDRKDNERGYEPGNLKLSTRLEQSNNRRTNRFVEYQGELVTIAEAARRSGISKITLGYRLAHGESDLFHPVEDTRVVYQGRKVTVTELSKLTGVPRRRLDHRLKSQGLSVEQAISPEFWGGRKANSLS